MGSSTASAPLDRSVSLIQREFVLPQYDGKVYVDKERSSIIKILSVPFE